jgi:hypothetical protein
MVRIEALDVSSLADGSSEIDYLVRTLGRMGADVRLYRYAVEAPSSTVVLSGAGQPIIGWGTSTSEAVRMAALACIGRLASDFHDEWSDPAALLPGYVIEHHLPTSATASNARFFGGDAAAPADAMHRFLSSRQLQALIVNLTTRDLRIAHTTLAGRIVVTRQ